MSGRGAHDRPHRTPPAFHAPPASFPRFSALRERRGRRSRYLYPCFCAPAPIFSGPALRASAAPAPASLRTGILCVSAPEPPPLRNYRLNRDFCGPDCRPRTDLFRTGPASFCGPGAAARRPERGADRAAGRRSGRFGAGYANRRRLVHSGTELRFGRNGPAPMSNRRPPVPQGAKRALGRSIARPSPNGRGRPK